MLRTEKMADGRVPLSASSGYISENRGTLLLKNRRGIEYYTPPFFGTTNQLCPFHAVNKYPAVSLFDQGIYPVVSFAHLINTHNRQNTWK